MSPIRAQARTDEPEAGPADGAPGVRRGRHRKPRPRKVLLAAGGLALAAGVLSLVRVAPDTGVGAPGTAEAEPRQGTDGGATDHAVNTSDTAAADPTALPSAASVMGGRTPTPTTPAASASTTPPPAAPATAPTTPVPTPSSSAPHPSATPPATHPTATATAPAPTTPAPTPSTAEPAPGGLCVPVLGLCVDAPGNR